MTNTHATTAENSPRLVRYGSFQSRDTDTTTYRFGRSGLAKFRDIHAVDDAGNILGNVCSVRVNSASTEQQTNIRIFEIVRLLELGRQANAKSKASVA
jgi:hypothetical protein